MATYGLWNDKANKHTCQEMDSLSCAHDDSGSKEHAKPNFEFQDFEFETSYKSFVWIENNRNFDF